MRPNGGAAFPISVHPEHGYGAAASVEQGMSLRSYFAEQALASGQCPYDVYQHEDRANWCLYEADALLKALGEQS